jgi:hypothetical protein
MSIRVHIPNEQFSDHPHLKETRFVDFPWFEKANINFLLPIGED